LTRLQDSVLKRNFNWLGYIYNPLKRLFLWNRPENVIKKSVSEFKFHSTILIVGGGADNTVMEILKQGKSLEITHLDISSVLSLKGQKRISKLNQYSRNVQFKIKPFLEFQTKYKYQAVIFPFYLDLYTEQEVIDNIIHTRGLLDSNGIIYVIDFSSNQKQTLWMRIKVMFLYAVFFPIIHQKRIAIPDYDNLFKKSGYQKLFEHHYYKGFYSVKAFTLNF
jgi:hypothetical protein